MQHRILFHYSAAAALQQLRFRTQCDIMFFALWVKFVRRKRYRENEFSTCGPSLLFRVHSLFPDS